jgi:hypothetical protein
MRHLAGPELSGATEVQSGQGLAIPPVRWHGQGAAPGSNLCPMRLASNHRCPRQAHGRPGQPGRLKPRPASRPRNRMNASAMPVPP